VVGVGVDQGTKWLASRELERGVVHSFLGDTLRVTYALNPGAFLGLGGDLSEATRFWLLTGLNAVFLTAIAGVVALHWNMRTVSFVALSLLLAGGVGNLIDRVTQDGLVTDFLNVGLGPVRTGIFNVADMAIMAGAGVLLVQSFRDERRQAAEKNTDVTSVRA
jgi:signal peptidase II